MRRLLCSLGTAVSRKHAMLCVEMSARTEWGCGWVFWGSCTGVVVLKLCRLKYLTAPRQVLFRMWALAFKAISGWNTAPCAGTGCQPSAGNSARSYNWAVRDLHCESHMICYSGGAVVYFNAGEHLSVRLFYKRKWNWFKERIYRVFQYTELMFKDPNKFLKIHPIKTCRRASLCPHQFLCSRMQEIICFQWRLYLLNWNQPQFTENMRMYVSTFTLRTCLKVLDVGKVVAKLKLAFC